MPTDTRVWRVAIVRPPTQITFRLRRRRFPVARAGRTRDPRLEITGYLTNVG